MPPTTTRTPIEATAASRVRQAQRGNRTDRDETSPSRWIITVTPGSFIRRTDGLA
jgi:hypothetical protein